MFPDQVQAEIIEHDYKKRIRVTAGPGSGKTEVAAARLLELIKSGVRPQEISVLSFSRAAVANFNRRVAVMIDDDFLKKELRLVTVRTFDSFAFNLLTYNGYEGRELLRNTHDMNVKLATALLKESDDVPEPLSAKKHFFIDEFQDLPSVRGEFVYQLLAKLCRSDDFGFTLLGDPAQAIFSFADAGKANDWWGRIGIELAEVNYEMATNYRAAPELSEFIQFFHGCFGKADLAPAQLLRAASAMFSELEGTSVLPDNSSEAVLTRTNGELLLIHRHWFGESEEPQFPLPNFIMRDSRVSPPAWVARIFRDCCTTYLNFAEIAEMRERMLGAEKFPDDDYLKKILFLSKSVENNRVNFPVFRSRLRWPHIWPDDLSMSRDGPVFSTIHQAKGLEFDKVSLLRSPNGNEVLIEENQAREESSVLFVAFSRAKTDLKKFALPSGWRIYEKDFGGSLGRRWLCNVAGGVHFEVRQSDVCPDSFVSRSLSGSDENVLMLQNFLWEKRNWLVGRKVVLCRKFDPEKRQNHFMIHIQENGQPSMLLGRMSESSEFWKLVHKVKGNSNWPSLIYNLRIASVESMSIKNEATEDMVEPFRTSGIWLGVRLHGLGFFRRGQG